MNDVKVSIIIPVYLYQEKFIACLESTLKQNFPERYEVLLLLLGSDKKTIDIALNYEKKNPEIFRVYSFAFNKGPCLSRNIGIFLSRGKYITFLDSDDELKPDFLNKLYLLAIKENYDIVCSGYYYHKKRKHKGYSRINYKGDSKKIVHKLLYSPFLKVRSFCWGRLYKSELLKNENIYFKTDLKFYEDIPFILEAYSKAKKVCFIKKPLYIYNKRKGSWTDTIKDTLTYHIRSYDSCKEYLPKNKKIPFAIKLQIIYDSYISSKIRKKKFKIVYNSAIKELNNIF